MEWYWIACITVYLTIAMVCFLMGFVCGFHDVTIRKVRFFFECLIWPIMIIGSR